MIDVLILNSQNQAAMGCGRPPPPAPASATRLLSQAFTH